MDARPGPNPILPDAYEIDPAFREFYEHLGGVQVLGPAISPLFVHEEINYQYTVSALMVLDPNAPPDQRFYLAALGLELGIAEPAVDAPQHSKYYLNGHSIADPFIPMFEKIGGERYTGLPITEMRYNPEKKRYEQYFENVGMFLLEGDDPENVGLQAYGAWKCNASCRQPQIGASTVDLIHRVDEVFIAKVEQLGIDFTGSAISGAYQTAEGDIEQVFTNVVLVAKRGSSSQVFLRGITQRIGMHPDPFSAASEDPQMYFYPMDAGGSQGYNVPLRFMDYLTSHGGREVSGPPIGELESAGEAVLQQCFLNLCLEETRNAHGESIIRPMQLGYTYKLWSQQSGAPGMPPKQTPLPTFEPARKSPPARDDLPLKAAIPTSNPSDPAAGFLEPPSPELSIQVWESFPWVSSKQSMEIGVSVFENDQPLPGTEPELVVFLPDGTRSAYHMPPTDNEGQTRKFVEPVEAADGTLILYQACISNSTGGKFCVKDSFLIWQNP